jgi:hypothetical protein
MAKRNSTGTNTDRSLREHLVKLLEGGHAHASFDAAIKGLPSSLRARTPRGLPYSAWHLLEHMRIAQWDILEFSRDRTHQSPRWPEGYWPAPDNVRPSESAWRKSVAAFRRDLKAMQALVADPATDLFAPIPWGDGQTILREALLVSDHNAYHLGELVVGRRLLGVWGG